MKIVVDINHPAHVHFFKNFIWEIRKKGHEVLITASEKDIACKLLDSYGFDYINLGSYGAHLAKKLINLPLMDLKMYKAIRSFKPDLFIGLASFRAAHTSFLLRKKCIIFDDTEHRKEIWLYLPFIPAVFNPSCFKKDLGKKQTRYNGYHELAYLHPHYFTPNPEVLKEIRLSENEKFFIIRFVSWQAIHDLGEKGFSIAGKRRLIKELGRYGRVIITSESHLPEEFEKYKMPISPTKIHDLLYYATLYIGEGATMASEATVLGTPAIFVSSITAGTLEEQEKRYGLLYSFRNEDEAIKKALDLLKTKELKQQWQKKREIMLKDKIDVTAWIVDLIEKKIYPNEMAK